MFGFDISENRINVILIRLARDFTGQGVVSSDNIIALFG